MRRLIAALLNLQLPEAPKSQPEPHRDCVSRKQLDELLAESEKRANWLLEEWYEKFSTLHARLAKRAQVKAPNGAAPVEELQQPLRSVLAHRKPWSV